MNIQNTKNQILNLLEKEGFLTVNKLSQILYVSESSVRRHLTTLQNQGLVRRTHGGAMLSEMVDRIPSLNSRMTRSVLEKRKIAKKAASFLRDDQSVMLDGSTTAGFLVPYLARFRNIVLFTNNMETALKAIGFGINTHCIGGHSSNQSAVLSGENAYQQVSELYPDILFFSSQCLNTDGIISDANHEENYLRVQMLLHAKETVFLCDSNKFKTRSLYRLTSLEEVDYAVFDRDYPNLQTEHCQIIV